MPRILFWNVNRKDLTPIVCALAISSKADVIVLNENKVASNLTLKALRSDVTTDFHMPSPSSEERFHCFCRDRRLDLSEVHQGFRTSVRNLNIGSGRVLLTLVHGVDPRNYDSEARQEFAHSLASELSFAKKQYGTNRLALLGDFNLNPYDRGMNLATGLNAMMTRICASAAVRRHLSQDYELYYNPMWSLLGDNTKGPAGTVYDTSNQGHYGWSMFDQAVLNHSIVHLFEDIEILTKAGQYSLMNKKGRPDSKNVSDHFPIILTLKEQ